MQFLRLLSIVLASYVIIAGDTNGSPAESGFSKPIVGQPLIIAASPERGFNFPYILRLPERRSVETTLFLLVEPNNSGSVSDDFEFHLQAAKSLMSSGVGAATAKALNVPLLIPVFPRPKTAWHIYTHTLDRDTMLVVDGPLARLDHQLIAMIEDARIKLAASGVPTHEKILLTGFSASGKFVNRFTALHPERVQAAASGAVNGLLILPVAAVGSVALPYPLGISDFANISGAPFQASNWKRVPQFIYMGASDQNDAVQYEDGYSTSERAIVFNVIGRKMQPDRWEYCQSVYRAAGASAVFRTYPAVGHSTNRQIHSDVIDFFKSRSQSDR